MLASTLSIGILACLNDRPTVEEIVKWIDVETILLLFSMMILVGILTETGVFDYLAVYAYKVHFNFLNEIFNFYLISTDHKWKAMGLNPLFVYYYCADLLHFR